MGGELADLFDGGSDCDLCDRLAVRIEEVRGRGHDPSTLSDEERTVSLVWLALGVIGNGGFRYLFEAPVRGDPHYALTRLAFETIGCRPAVGAIDGALSAFPGRRPPADPEERLRAYVRRFPGFPDENDRAFFAARTAAERGLAEWVRGRRRAFAVLG